jgi:hypothetical protein
MRMPHSLEGALFLLISSDITGDLRRNEMPLLAYDIRRLMCILMMLIYLVNNHNTI